MTSDASFPHVAMIYNPSKPGWRQRVHRVESFAKSQSIDLRLYETTVDDPGMGVAKTALSEGPELIVVSGGDGTVRSVAHVIRGSGVPMGILPGGTGNLLARNLGLPITDVESAITVAFLGQTIAIDIGVATIERYDPSAADQLVEEVHGSGGILPFRKKFTDDNHPNTEQIHAINLPESEEHTFLIVAGLGLDAEMIKNTSSRLKRTMGWIAYLYGGFKSLATSKRRRHSFVVDDSHGQTARAHSVMVANCARLPGGINFLPDAKIDDGKLDLVVLKPNRFGDWVQLSFKILKDGGRSSKTKLSDRVHAKAENKHLRILQGASVKILPHEPMPAEIDGDLLGIVSSMHCAVEPGALLVRTPR